MEICEFPKVLTCSVNERELLATQLLVEDAVGVPLQGSLNPSRASHRRHLVAPQPHSTHTNGNVYNRTYEVALLITKAPKERPAQAGCGALARPKSAKNAPKRSPKQRPGALSTILVGGGHCGRKRGRGPARMGQTAWAPHPRLPAPAAWRRSAGATVQRPRAKAEGRRPRGYDTWWLPERGAGVEGEEGDELQAP